MGAPSPTKDTKPLNPAFLMFKVGTASCVRELLQAGQPLGYVKEQLGHSSISVTVDLHGHFVLRRDQAAVDRLAAATAGTEASPNFDSTSTGEEEHEQPETGMLRKSAI